MNPNYEDERNLTSVIIGLSDAVRWEDDLLDITPFPEGNLDMRIPGQGIVFVAEHFDNDGKKSRAFGGVVESHFSTANWSYVLQQYKKYLEQKGKTYSYIMILLNAELVYNEVIAGNLV